MSTVSGSSQRPSMPEFSPQEPKSVERKSEESPFQRQNKAVCNELASGKVENFTPIKTSGGHGGFCTADVTVEGKTVHLFLKPFDPAEFNNFYFIQLCCAGQEEKSILKYMPRVYGEVTLNGTQYMVMQNLFLTDDNKSWKQVADLKMTKGGQYDDSELEATERKKGLGAKFVQSVQSLASSEEGFMPLSGNKFMRTVRAFTTKTSFVNEFSKALQNVPLAEQPKLLEGAIKQFIELRNLLADKKCPMGFIGASVFVFLTKHSEDKQFKVYLADPAHAIAEPLASGMEQLSQDQREKMYWGDGIVSEKTAQFINQKKLNAESVEEMLKLLMQLKDEISTKVPAEDRLVRARHMGGTPPPVSPRLGPPSEKSSPRAVARSRTPSPESDTKKTWKKVTPSSDAIAKEQEVSKKVFPPISPKSSPEGSDKKG